MYKIFIRAKHSWFLQKFESLPCLKDTDDAADVETIQAEGTILYHIRQAASLGNATIKDYLAAVKNLTKAPEFILNTFQLSVLLTISSVNYYEDKVFELIKASITHSLSERKKKLDSHWLRNTITSDLNITKVLTDTVECSVENRDCVLQGLLNLGFLLLGVGSALGRDEIAEQQWQLGNFILFKMVKIKKHLAQTVFQILANKIISSHNTQYLDCLYNFTKKLPLVVLENQSCIIELIDTLVQCPASTANNLLDAIFPLAKISANIRDHLIMLLRKTLYSRNTETRQVAVIGLLKLLKNLKISNLVALSQSSDSSSGHSVFTQISLNRSGLSPANMFSNESLCLEVLGILRRCFIQQAPIKQQFYEGLYDAVCMNSELCLPVLNLLWSHFNNFYVSDEEITLPLHLDKITATKDTNVVLQEPLGKLIYNMGLIALKAQETESEDAAVLKVLAVLESLCKRMINCELYNFQLDNSIDLLDNTSESQEKMFILKECMSIYEALIGYKICSWNSDSENCGQQISSLHQGLLRLHHFSKNSNKPKKVERKKKNDSTLSSQSTQSLKKDKHKIEFKLPDTLLDFQCLTKILHLLHDPEVNWTTAAQANVLKIKHEIHQYIMQCCIDLVNSIKSRKSIDPQIMKVYYTYCCEIAGIVYMRCIKRLEEFVDFDFSSGILATECFGAILNIINSLYKNNLSSFLSNLEGKLDDGEVQTNLKDVINVIFGLVEIDDDKFHMKELKGNLLNCLLILCNNISVDSTCLSTQVLDWSKDFLTKKVLTSRSVHIFITLTLNMFRKFKSNITLYQNIFLKLTQIFGSVNEELVTCEEMEFINESSATTSFQDICHVMKTMLDEIDFVIHRLKSTYFMLNYSGEESMNNRRESLKANEKAVCCQMCLILTLSNLLVNITIRPGPNCESAFKLLISLFNSLNTLTKYFILRSTKLNPVFQNARFERVVKMSGKELSPSIYKFILYFEESRKQEDATHSKKKTPDASTMKNKILKETRMIPKIVYEMEQFSKSIIQLSNKTKIDLSKNIGQGTTRDFRILQLKEVVEKTANDSNHDDSTMDETINDAENSDNQETQVTSDEDEEENIPPSKKSRQN